MARPRKVVELVERFAAEGYRGQQLIDKTKTSLVQESALHQSRYERLRKQIDAHMLAARAQVLEQERQMYASRANVRRIARYLADLDRVSVPALDVTVGLGVPVQVTPPHPALSEPVPNEMGDDDDGSTWTEEDDA